MTVPPPDAPGAAQRERERTLHTLVTTRFDLLIVGGGILGAFAALDAAARGLRVAMIDRGDFGGATSSNSMKIAHGGLRYLQQADVRRARQSARERATLFAIAPGLVRPLPCVIATRGHMARSRLAFHAALRVNSLITHPHHRAGDAALPPNRVLTLQEYAYLAGPFATPDATGGALWHDGLIHSTERLLISIVRSAVDAGAVVANYVEAQRIVVERGRVIGATIDAHGSAFARVDADPLRHGGASSLGMVRATVTLDAAGPWSAEFTGARAPNQGWVRSCNVVVRGERARVAVAIASPLGRQLFAVPWRGHTILGTTQARHAGPAGDTSDVEPEVETLLREANAAVADLALRREDVTLIHAGLVPAAGPRSHTPARHADPIDQEGHGFPGLVTARAVKWTTARHAAEEAVDLCVRRLGGTPGQETTMTRAITGAEGGVPGATAGSDSRRSGGVTPAIAALYGSRADELAIIAHGDAHLAAPLADGVETTRAQVTHAIRFEFAQRLSDIVLRRSELGSAGYPGDAAVEAAAAIAAAELGWSPTRRQLEVDAVRSAYPNQSR